METFPIVKRKDIARTEVKDSSGKMVKEGYYRTKELILEIYDKMAETMANGTEYQTILDPPPGPPCDAQGNFIPMAKWDTSNWPEHIHPPKGVEIKRKTPTLKPIYTIGYSNVPIENVITLLKANSIQILVDVRSVPYSKYVSQANKENLEAEVKAKGMKYLFMGDKLGGKPKGIEIEDEHGNIDYSNLKEEHSFKEGLDRLLKGARDFTLCLMCSEEDPAKCHRGMLLAKEFTKLGVKMRHIRHSGKIESQEVLEGRIPAKQEHLF